MASVPAESILYFYGKKDAVKKAWCLGLQVASGTPSTLSKSSLGIEMPKMKTKSGAKKRLKVLGNGGIKRAHAFKRHILTKKTTKNKRQLRGTTMVRSCDMASVAKMLPYA